MKKKKGFEMSRRWVVIFVIVFYVLKNISEYEAKSVKKVSRICIYIFKD